MNAMSVDVEDYFHVTAFEGVVSRGDWDRMESRVVRNTERLLDIFEEYRVRSTFFVLGWVGERHPDLVRSIARAGHEIASHGYEHRLIYRQTPAEFREDLRRAKSLLEDVSGRPVLGYRAPSFSITRRSLWALDILLEEGYRYDASIFPIRHDRYGLPTAERGPHVVQLQRGTLLEFPASTVCIANLNLPVSGGGYFRILPFWWTERGMSRINDVERRPAVFYLHPWEIDPEQPRIRTTRLNAFRHYRNLHQTEQRLRKLLGHFRFDTIERLLPSAAARSALAGELHADSSSLRGAPRC